MEIDNSFAIIYGPILVRFKIIGQYINKNKNVFQKPDLKDH